MSQSVNAGHAGQMCVKCIVDTTVPGHNFDADGICSYCRMQDHLEKQHPLTPDGAKKLDTLIGQIKKKGKDSPDPRSARLSVSPFSASSVIDGFGGLTRARGNGTE